MERDCEITGKWHVYRVRHLPGYLFSVRDHWHVPRNVGLILLILCSPVQFPATRKLRKQFPTEPRYPGRWRILYFISGFYCTTLCLWPRRRACLFGHRIELPPNRSAMSSSLSSCSALLRHHSLMSEMWKERKYDYMSHYQMQPIVVTNIKHIQ